MVLAPAFGSVSGLRALSPGSASGLWLRGVGLQALFSASGLWLLARNFGSVLMALALGSIITLTGKKKNTGFLSYPMLTPSLFLSPILRYPSGEYPSLPLPLGHLLESPQLCLPQSLPHLLPRQETDIQEKEPR